MKNNEICVPYFAEREEQAVIDYINSESIEEKSKIYNIILIIPFRKMIQSILRRYPIYVGNYSMEEMEENALTHLIEHMIKYRPFIIEYNIGNEKCWIKSKEFKYFLVEEANEKLNKLINKKDNIQYRIFYAKAYSYCQTIIRNYYKDHSKKSYTEKKINLCYDDYAEDINESSEFTYEIETENQQNLENLINDVIVKIDSKITNDTTMKKNEIIVGDAIINVLKNWHILFMEDSPEGKYNKKITNKFAKNKILLFLKEQTELSTKEIRIAIKPFKDIYFLEKTDYFND